MTFGIHSTADRQENTHVIVIVIKWKTSAVVYTKIEALITADF